MDEVGIAELLCRRKSIFRSVKPSCGTAEVSYWNASWGLVPIIFVLSSGGQSWSRPATATRAFFTDDAMPCIWQQSKIYIYSVFKKKNESTDKIKVHLAYSGVLWLVSYKGVQACTYPKSIPNLRRTKMKYPLKKLFWYVPQVSNMYWCGYILSKCMTLILEQPCFIANHCYHAIWQDRARENVNTVNHVSILLISFKALFV